MSEITWDVIKEQSERVKRLQDKYDDSVKEKLGEPEKWLTLWLTEAKKLNLMLDLYYFHKENE